MISSTALAFSFPTRNILVLSLGFYCLVSSAILKGSIVWNDLCPDFNTLGNSRIVLDDGRQWQVNVRRDGSFSINDVIKGRYVLSVNSHDHVYDQVIVEVRSNESTVEPEIIPYTSGTPITSNLTPVKLPYPVKLLARRRNNYYVPHEGFNIVGMFKNPMMLMMLFAAIMVFATPYLMAKKNLDPEAAKEIQERRNAMTGMQNTLQNFDIGGGLVNLLGSQTDEDEIAKKSGLGPEKKQATASSVRTKNTKSRRK